MIDITDAVFQKMHSESSLKQVFTCVSYAVFSGNPADIYVCGVQQLENLFEGLTGIIHSFIAGILLDGLVTSLVESQFLPDIGEKVLVYLSSVCAGNAVRRPYASLFLE